MYRFGEGCIEEYDARPRRGEIYITDGVFKPMDEKEDGDYTIGKVNRPVLVISNDEHNEHVVRVLVLSTSSGKIPEEGRIPISAYREIEIPSVCSSRHDRTYIDTYQTLTVNSSKLRKCIASVSKEVVDTAVCLSTLKALDKTGVKTLIKVLMKEQATADLSEDTEFKDLVSTTVGTNLVEKIVKSINSESVCNVTSLQEAQDYYKEWLNGTTDTFRRKYKLTKDQYQTIKTKCINFLTASAEGFNPNNWVG
jgi:mRNA-degrading endonuclease toxin of MazEF toxin-antitoxin module